MKLKHNIYRQVVSIVIIMFLVIFIAVAIILPNALIPIYENKLFNVLDKASIKIASNEKTIDVDISGELIRIPLYEIMYIEVNRNYVTIHAKCNYTLKSTLSKFASLDEKNFVKVGRSYIINLNYITRVSKQSVHLKNNEKIILPRGMYEVLNKKIISNI